ncbi:MAG: putative rane protein [Proteobacteria bacterium]|nr:putative rane protein [Pseudomonadota bacterium]
MHLSESLFISVIIVLCSICQSIIGVGLVMIGIPTLILFGYSFELALSICLPGSLIINIFQVSLQYKLYQKDDFSSYFIMSITYLLFLFFVNLFLHITFNKITAGIILILTGVVGCKIKTRDHFLSFLNKKTNITNFSIGIIHSISSLGGSVLSLAGAAKYNDSYESRRFISGGYLSLGVIQLTFYLYHGVNIKPALYSFIAVPVYYLSSQYVSPHINQHKLKSFIFTVIFIYGVLLISQSI